MKIKFSKIEDAFEFVSSGGYGDQAALLDKKTGAIYFQSEYGDFDEIPDEKWESDNTLEIPHKKSLDLGTHLVFRFVDEFMPDDYGRVQNIFSRRSAYAYYRDLLAERGILDKWYTYENSATQRAVREWCADEGVELED